MLYRTDFDENGRKTLCQMDGVNADMLMDIFVQKLAPGDTLTLEEAEKECAVLLLSGQVTFAVGNSINETCAKIHLKRSPTPCTFAGAQKPRLLP